jgi:hypothetical protein
VTRFEEIVASPPRGSLGFPEVDHLVPVPGSLVLRSNDGGLTVLVSEELHGDGNTYLHVSFSRRSRTPSYEDLDWVRKAFIGEERECVRVFPPKAEYVNFQKHTLHLWHCYERRIFPEVRA